MAENNEKNVEKSKDQEKDVSDNKVKELTVEQKLKDPNSKASLISFSNLLL